MSNEIINHDNLIVTGWKKQTDDSYEILLNNISIRLRLEKGYGDSTFKIRLSQILEGGDRSTFDIDCRKMIDLRILIGLLSKVGVLSLLKEVLI